MLTSFFFEAGLESKFSDLAPKLVPPKSFTHCGVAFPRKKEEGYVLKLDVQNMTGDYLLSQKKEWKES